MAVITKATVPRSSSASLTFARAIFLLYVILISVARKNPFQENLFTKIRYLLAFVHMYIHTKKPACM
jgi:hypothetical protein